MTADLSNSFCEQRETPVDFALELARGVLLTYDVPHRLSAVQLALAARMLWVHLASKLDA